MNKKFLSALTAFICAASAMTVGTASVSAVKTGEHNGLNYKTVDEDFNGSDDSVEITGCNNTSEDFNIPAVIGGLPVKFVTPGAFKNDSSLKQITVDEKNEYLDAEGGVLFTEGKKELICYPGKKPDTTYSIPGSVKIIGKYAFSGSTKLTKMSIPSTVEAIGEGAFEKCSALAEVSIPKGVESVGTGAFTGTQLINDQKGPFYYADSWLVECSKNDIDVIKSTSNSIKSGTTGIAGGVFAGKTKLNTIEVPDTVLYISEAAFNGCKSLTNVVIPSSVKRIDAAAFANCTTLTKLELPNQIKSLGESVFRGCSALNTINIPTGVTVIPESAFRSCISLDTIDIPAKVEEIKEFAFRNCPKLMNVYIRNKDCVIYDTGATISHNDYDVEGDFEDGTIHGYAGSTAEKYTSKYGIAFDVLNGSAAGLHGDANGDGKVNVRDAAFIAGSLAKGNADALPDEADYNGDGKKNVRDAAAIASDLAKGKI